MVPVVAYSVLTILSSAFEGVVVESWVKNCERCCDSAFTSRRSCWQA